ncbi:MAG: DNA cytosine methyltransferase [Thaumarchaeota archaeon]|nr:DNA cytosine methyltransferase [Nitrososphaerota archaeon]
MPKPIAIDAFCGAGGLSLGLTKAGFDVCFSFDNDEKAIETYQLNLGKHALLSDVHDINLKKELSYRGVSHDEIFLFAGGPPCQGFSLQRRGDDQDPRNDLVKVFFKKAFSIKPRFVMMENVLGMKTKRGISLIEYAIKKSYDNGYRCHIAELNAADFGAPQMRKRFFIVAERHDGSHNLFKFPEPIIADGKYKTVRDAMGDLPSPPSNGSEHADIPNHRCDVLSSLNRERFSHVPPSGGRADIPPSLRLRCHKVSVEKAGHRYVYGRLSWNKPSGVITARFDSLTRGRFGHPVENRTISLREGARLQTFPDDFIFVGTKVQVARQIGNAVPPVLAKALGREIFNVYKLLTQKSLGPKLC